MAGIFISYRREQTGAYAGRLYDRLVREFGAERVFMDYSGIAPGVDFVERLEEAVGDADALLVVMGPQWADLRLGDGRRRLEDAGDYVRREILGALEHDTLVVPVLVQDSEMPGAGDPPEPLRPLTRRNAIDLTDAGWTRDVEHLVATLRPHVGAPPRAAATRRRRVIVAS